MSSIKLNIFRWYIWFKSWTTLIQSCALSLGHPAHHYKHCHKVCRNQWTLLAKIYVVLDSNFDDWSHTDKQCLASSVSQFHQGYSGSKWNWPLEFIIALVSQFHQGYSGSNWNWPLEIIIALISHWNDNLRLSLVCNYFSLVLTK